MGVLIVAIGSNWISGANTIVNGTIWVALVGFVLGLIALLIWYKKYNKVVVVRKVVNGNIKVFMDKCRYLKDKEGVEWFKFLRLRRIAKIPPKESIDITSKGKDFLEAYFTETGEIQWGKGRREGDSIIIEPFTTEDRQTLQYQFYKAHLEGGLDWKTLINFIASLIAIVIISVSLMIFYKDMGEPLLKMGEQLAGFQKQQVDMMEQMNVMLERLCSSGYGNCTQVITGGNNMPVKIPS